MKRSTTDDHTTADVAPWWCSPAGIAIGFLMPMFGIVSFAVQLDLQGLTARGFHYLTEPYLILGVGLLAALALGGWLGQQLSSGGNRPAATHDIDRAAATIGVIALLAYLFWFRTYLLNPPLLWSILNGSSLPERADELVPGVTSLANGGPVFFCVYAWRQAFRRDEPIPPWMRALCVILLVLTAFRVYAWSERLALIEAILPFALATAVRAQRSPSRVVQVVLRLGPFLALPLLMAYFGLAESVRSWASDTYNGKLGFWDFVVGRLTTYYYTSLNNGAGYLATQDWPSFRFEYTLGMLYTAPLGIGRVFSALMGSAGPAFDTFLQRYGDVEFNNPSGLYMVVYDMGIPLGVGYFAIVGVVSGMLYRSYVRGSLASALLYPLFFISYLEVFRYPYLGSGRAFAWGMCAALVLLMVRPSRYRQTYDDASLGTALPHAGA